MKVVVRTLTSLVLLAISAPAPAGESQRGDGDRAASSALFDAVRQGDLARLRSLLRDGAGVGARDELGNTPLIQAALYGEAPGVALLLEHGADPNAVSGTGVTPLLRAAGDLAKVRLLLAAGADVNATSAFGNTALILAARHFGSEPIVRLLLDHGARVQHRNKAGVTAILTACASSDVRTVRLLIERGADVNPEILDHHESGWRTPLGWAAFRGDLDVVKLLLEQGARTNPTARPRLGVPLTNAAQGDQVEAARLLIEHGAEVDDMGAYPDYTALHWAASTETGDPALVELLIEHGADPNARGGLRVDAFLGVAQTPLMLAEKRGHTAVVDALVRAGAKRGSQARQEPAHGSRRELPATIDSALVRDAIERAVPLLQETALASRRAFLKHESNQNCISCHQQLLPLAAVSHARASGIPVDENKMRDLTSMIVASQRPHLDISLEPTFSPEPAHGFGYIGLALTSVGEFASDVTDAMVHHLAAIQGKDGQWHMNIPRPPIQTSDVGATALAALLLNSYPLPGRRRELDERIRRARDWLRQVKPVNHEALVYKLLGLAWAGESAEKLTGVTQHLLEAQRDDGGWAQLPKLASDAYATGQALYALHRGAGLATSHPAWQRGLRFLLSTQLDDGTWRVRRRAFPFQPTMKSGFPHSRDSWISSTATSWAVMALSAAVTGADEGEIADGRSSRRPVAHREEPVRAARSTATTTTTPVDFKKQILPVLERSCLGCHGKQKKPRGGLRVVSRASLLAGGNSGEAAIVPGRSDRSPLLRYVLGLEEDMEMPPPGKQGRFPALDAEEIDLVRAWIDQGAPWPAEAATGKDP